MLYFQHHQQKPDHLQSWFLGLDLGQRRGHSALVALELRWTHLGKDPVYWNDQYQVDLYARSIERFEHGRGYLSYIDTVEERLEQIGAVHGDARRATAPIYLAVDAGGPGMPVIEEMRRQDLILNLRPTWITGGLKENSKVKGGGISVPRRDLVTNVSLLLEHKTLQIPENLQGRDELFEELLALESDTSQPAQSTQTDDLAMALGLAAWQAIRAVPQLLPKPAKNPENLYIPARHLLCV